MPTKVVRLNIDVAPGLQFLCEKKLLKMVLENLVRNAFQYTHNGEILIKATQEGIEVINTCLKEDVQYQAPQDDYGYGVGLYLVEKICEQKDWKMTVKQSDEHFQVAMRF